MSRTYAHVPEAVELARIADRTTVNVVHRHGSYLRHFDCDIDDPQPRVGRRSCELVVPRWASKQRWSRRGTATFEKSAVVRDTLRRAALEFNSGLEVDVVMPAPARSCLCQMCGVR